MPKQQFALEKGEPKRLELSWGFAWRNFTVKLDGREIGRIEGGQKGLKQGSTFKLPNGRSLSVRLNQTAFSATLETLLDGKPLPGSGSDPETRLKNAYYIIFFIAGLNIVLGLIGLLVQSNFLESLGLGLASIIFGFIYLALGYFVIRRSRVALMMAIALFALDGILGFILTATADVTPNFGGLIARFFFLVPMVQGLSAIKELEG